MQRDTRDFQEGNEKCQDGVKFPSRTPTPHRTIPTKNACHIMCKSVHQNVPVINVFVPIKAIGLFGSQLDGIRDVTSALLA